MNHECPETTGCSKPSVRDTDSDYEELKAKTPGHDNRVGEDDDIEQSESSEPKLSALDFDDDLDFRPPLVRMTDWKNKGNAAFREGKYQEAIVFYSRGIDVNSDEEQNENSQEEKDENKQDQTSTEDHQEKKDENKQDQISAEDKSVKLMRSQLFSNRAACFLALEDYEMVITDSSEALKLEPNYVKALTRRGSAYEVREKYEESLKDFKRVMELEPRNFVVLKKIPGLEKKRKEQFEKQKEEMITKLKGMGNWVLNKFGMSVDDFESKQGPDGSWSIGMKNKKTGPS